jgi:magnesium chelatase family protein
LQEQGASAESSEVVSARVVKARALQSQRQGKCNARLSAADVDVHCVSEPAARNLLLQAMQKFSLSARAYHRILKVARSIADLESIEQIRAAHVAEAIALRRLDRGGA